MYRGRHGAACLHAYRDARQKWRQQNLSPKTMLTAEQATVVRCVVFSVRSAGGTKADAMKYLQVGFPRSTLNGMWDAWYENWRDDGLPIAAERSGRPPALSPRKRKRVSEELKAGGTCRQVAGMMGVSASTISNIAREQNVVARMPVFRPFLSDKAVANRLAFAKATLKNKNRPWERVLWSDESAVLLTPHQRHCVWVDVGTVPEAIQTYQFPKAIWVWGGISYAGATPLVFLKLPPKGGFKAENYQEQVLRKVKGWGDSMKMKDWMFMEDGARVHTAKVNQHYRDQLGIKPFPPKPAKWPASSPDLNPIENVWADMKHFIHQLPEYPEDEETMKKQLRIFWKTMTPEKCRRFIENYEQRLKDVIDAGGGNTKH